jgi:hypothetical protein
MRLLVANRIVLRTAIRAHELSGRVVLHPETTGSRGTARSYTARAWVNPYASTVVHRQCMTMTGCNVAGEGEATFVAITWVVVFASSVPGTPPLSRTPNVSHRPYLLHTASART